MPKSFIQFAVLALLPAAALAQAAATPAPTSPPATVTTAATATVTAAPKKLARNDPNRMVCEDVEELGSRLSSKRICMTNAEWKQQRSDSRDAVDHTQINRGCLQSGSC